MRGFGRTPFVVQEKGQSFRDVYEYSNYSGQSAKQGGGIWERPNQHLPLFAWKTNLNVERKVRVPAPFMTVTSFFSVDAVTTGRVLPFCSLSLMGRSRTTTCIWPSMLAKSSVSLLLAFWILLFGTVASRHVSVLVTVTRAS